MAEQKLHFVKKPNYRRVAADYVIRLRYAVFDVGEQEALEYRDDLYYLHGGYGGAFPKIERALEGLEVHAKVEVELAPQEGYGERNPELVISEPEELFPPEARYPGARLEGQSTDGAVIPFVVTRVEKGVVTVDGNHPMAGRHLRFVLEVLDIRKATAEELRAGYAFPPTQ